MSRPGPPDPAPAGASMPPLRVAHVLRRDAVAGTELMVATLAEHGRRHGVQATVLILDRPGPVARQLRAAGVPVRSLGGGGALRELGRLGRLVRSGRFDVLCGYGFRAGLATRMLARLLAPGTRTAVGVRGLYVTEVERIDGPRGRLAMVVERATAPLVDAYVANSPGALAVLEAHGIERRRLHWVPNGIDADRWTVPDRDGRPDPPTVVCVGRFTPVKRQADLVDAAALLRDRGIAARFVLVGSGPTEDLVRRRVTQLDLSDVVAVVGPRSPSEMSRLLADADVACLPSSQEGMPGSVMEAMASALPVVGTRVNGIADLVRDGETGLLVPPADPAALADALERVLRDPALRLRLGAAGRRRIVERFSLERMVAETSDLLRSLPRRA
ncbi:MAG: glycosyltransferase [Patulibacter sp.]